MNAQRHVAICEHTGKVRMTRSQAKSEARRVEKRAHVPVSAYRCQWDDCGGWHVGTKKSKLGYSYRPPSA